MNSFSISSSPIFFDDKMKRIPNRSVSTIFHNPSFYNSNNNYVYMEILEQKFLHRYESEI